MMLHYYSVVTQMIYQFADIVLDDGHTVDVYQRYGSHTTNIDLTNAGGGYNLDLNQTSTSQTKSIILLAHALTPTAVV